MIGHKQGETTQGVICDNSGVYRSSIFAAYTQFRDIIINKTLREVSSFVVPN